MNKEQANIINCSTFEELLTDYLDKSLETAAHKSVASHALSCPLCHTLLNEVKESLEVCRKITSPAASVTRLEARVLSMTMPQTAIPCVDFEASVTDYLDGFLPAVSFHRWERHAALCTDCEDLPGMVVRSIATLYTYKSDELAVPAGLHDKILQTTIGTAVAREIKASWTSQAGEWIRSLRFPIGIPQLAPVAMLMLVAFMVFSQTVSADGSLAGVYEESFKLAEKTYQQSADAWNGKPIPLEQAPNQEPITGTVPVDHEGNK